ncbi:hypothetical protein EVAR_84713_1 [Eumeta japonica]|uniref:Uncharacterized protein n=1 Tax=Eumeta variegata TaxID=151549 RepID=A0A4C1VS52_EUMVA|nr:hypothetical protein EVAR_84713_1 [Eumeta japonica]
MGTFERRNPSLLRLITLNPIGGSTSNVPTVRSNLIVEILFNQMGKYQPVRNDKLDKKHRPSNVTLRARTEITFYRLRGNGNGSEKGEWHRKLCNDLCRLSNRPGALSTSSATLKLHGYAAFPRWRASSVQFDGCVRPLTVVACAGALRISCARVNTPAGLRAGRRRPDTAPVNGLVFFRAPLSPFPARGSREVNYAMSSPSPCRMTLEWPTGDWATRAQVYGVAFRVVYIYRRMYV